VAIFTIPEYLEKDTVPLWDGPAPHSLGATPNDIPTLTRYLPPNAGPATPAIILFPGGGYEFLAFDHEGIKEAEWFQARGVAAFILKYRLPIHGYRHPVPLRDAQRAVRLVRARAGEWNVDPARLGVMGFSAGGHLASTLDTHFDAGHPEAADPVERESCRPDYAVLVYALVSMKGEIAHQGSLKNLLGPEPDPALIENLSNETQVTPRTPPTLLVHTEDDAVVPIAHSQIMFTALQKAGVASAFHAYPHGHHGFGLGPDLVRREGPAEWLDRAGEWIKAHGFMP